MISSILDTSTKMTRKANNNNEGMVLIWSKNNYDDLESVVNNKDITQIIIEPDTTANKQFFRGRDLENIINNLQYDILAISCYVSRSLDKIIIYKNKKNKKKGDSVF